MPVKTIFANTTENGFLTSPELPKLQKTKSSKSEYFKTEKQKKKELKNELKRLEEAEKKRVGEILRPHRFKIERRVEVESKEVKI